MFPKFICYCIALRDATCFLEFILVVWPGELHYVFRVYCVHTALIASIFFSKVDVAMA